VAIRDHQEPPPPPPPPPPEKPPEKPLDPEDEGVPAVSAAAVDDENDDIAPENRP
jgi:hypothetical protein